MNVCRAALVGIALLVGWGGVAGASGTSSAPIKVGVALQRSRVVAGQPIKGTVTLTNTTSRQITVESCARNGWLQVGLKGRGYTYQANSTLIACPPSIRLAPGANRFPVTVLTTYESCLQPGGEWVYIVAFMYVNRPTSFACREVLHDRLHHGPSAFDGTFAPDDRDSPTANGTEEVVVRASLDARIVRPTRHTDLLQCGDSDRGG